MKCNVLGGYMAEGNSIKDEVKEQRKKFLTLTFTGKLQYIWEYYRIPIAAGGGGYSCCSCGIVIYKCLQKK